MVRQRWPCERADLGREFLDGLCRSRLVCFDRTLRNVLKILDVFRVEQRDARRNRARNGAALEEFEFTEAALEAFFAATERLVDGVLCSYWIARDSRSFSVVIVEHAAESFPPD